MPLLFLRSAASLFRRGTPQKNNPQPPRPGVSLYHTSQAHSSHAGISPTKGVEAATPCFTLQPLPFGRGTPKNNPQPPRPGVDLYHTSQAHSSHSGISPTKGVGSMPCFR